MSVLPQSLTTTAVLNPYTPMSYLRKRNVKPNLLSINLECREMILEMLLQNKVRCWNDAVIDNEVVPIELHIPYVGENDEVIYKYVISKTRIAIGNINMIRVCRQLHFEGCAILTEEGHLVGGVKWNLVPASI